MIQNALSTKLTDPFFFTVLLPGGSTVNLTKIMKYWCPVGSCKLNMCIHTDLHTCSNTPCYIGSAEKRLQSTAGK